MQLVVFMSCEPPIEPLSTLFYHSQWLIAANSITVIRHLYAIDHEDTQNIVELSSADWMHVRSRLIHSMEVINIRKACIIHMWKRGFERVGPLLSLRLTLMLHYL